MAKHEFGIMKNAPRLEERFDTYEPEKYACISVRDDYIEPLLERFNEIDCFWHTLKCPGKNLAYCGITLIPPTSMTAFIKALEGTEGTEELIKLFSEAEKENRFLIHFGI